MQAGRPNAQIVDDRSYDDRSFDDDVLTSAQQHAQILRDLGYRTEAAHVDRFVNLQTQAHDAPAA
jgi:hypothetical protein